MTQVAHDKRKETPARETDQKTPTRRPPANLDRTGLALRWAAVLIGLGALVALTVLVVTADRTAESDVAAGNTNVVASAQLTPKLPEGFAPTGWEAETVTLILVDPASRPPMVPRGYVPTGWLPPEATIVVPAGDLVRLVLPEAYVPVNG